MNSKNTAATSRLFEDSSSTANMWVTANDKTPDITEDLNRTNADDSSPSAVIFTSIRANSLKICDVNCLNCKSSSSKAYIDGRIYFNIIQLMIG